MSSSDNNNNNNIKNLLTECEQSMMTQVRPKFFLLCSGDNKYNEDLFTKQIVWHLSKPQPTQISFYF